MWGAWFKPFGEDSFQKRLAKYLLKQTVGRFLSSNVDWDSYDFQLVNGQVTMRDLHMDVQAINKIVGNRLGLQVVSGHIGTLRIVVPWNGFFTEACSMEIEDLTIQLTEIDSTSHSTKAPGSTKGADGNLQDHKQALVCTRATNIAVIIISFADNFIRTELGDDEADSPSMSFTLNEPGSDVSAFPASPNISLSPTISSSVWLNSFDIACDIDRIVVVLHPFTIRDVLNLFSNHSHDQMQGCTPSQTFPPQSDEAHTPTIGSPSDSLPQSVEPFMFTLHVEDINLQRHQSLAGQAIGIDLTHQWATISASSEVSVDEMSTILSTIPLKDVPVRDKMQEFLINKTELPRATPTSSSLDEIPIDGWSHHIAVVLPPMMLYIVTDVLEDIQTYVSSINSLKSPMSSELGSDVSEEQQGGIKVSF
ncbi:hypothetical protein BASA62_002031 [Batrachochytrium salamandrivorans]|nr:hypothetical protein BASA62_002031 [Batrachochytrium salamandrivorans]